MSNEKLNRRNVLVGAAVGTAAVSSIGFVRPAYAADYSNAITLLATLQIAEGKRDDAIKYLDALTKAVEKNEPGTLAYAAHTFKDDPNKVIFFEVYDGPEGQKNHNPGKYNADLGVSAAGCFVGGPKIELIDRVAGYIR